MGHVCCENILCSLGKDSTHKREPPTFQCLCKGGKCMPLRPLAEDRPHCSPDRFGAVQIGTRSCEQHRSDPQRIRRADHRADIAGILHIFQHNGIVRCAVLRPGRDLHRKDRSRAVSHGRGSLKHLFRCNDLANAGKLCRARSALLPEDRFYFRPGVKCLFKQFHSVTEVQSLFPAHLRLPPQKAKLCDDSVFSGCDSFHISCQSVLIRGLCPLHIQHFSKLLGRQHSLFSLQKAV